MLWRWLIRPDAFAFARATARISPAAITLAAEVSPSAATVGAAPLT